MKYYFGTYFIALGIILLGLMAMVFHFTPPFYQAAVFGASSAFLFGWVIPCASYFTDKEPERDRVWYLSMFNKRYPSEVLIQVLICVICFVLYKVGFLPRFNCFLMPIAGMILITYLFEWFWVRCIVRKDQTDLTKSAEQTEQPEQKDSSEYHHTLHPITHNLIQTVMTKRKKQTIQKIVETGPRHARQAAFDAMVAQEQEKQQHVITHYTCQLVQSFKVEGLNTPTILSTLFSTMLYFLGEDQSKDKTRSMEDYFQPELERFRTNLAERMSAIRSGEIVFDPIPLPADPDALEKERPN